MSRRSSSSSSASTNQTTTTTTTTVQDHDTTGGSGLTLGAGSSIGHFENLSTEALGEVTDFGVAALDRIADLGADILDLGNSVADGIGQTSENTFNLAEEVINRSRDNAEKIAGDAVRNMMIMVVAVFGFMALSGKVKFA